MTTLKESILKSVKAGKYALIEDWCKKYIRENQYKIQSDYKITNAGNWDIYLVYTDKDLFPEAPDAIPEYIQFGKLQQNFVIGEHINMITQEQLPEICEGCYIGNVVTLKNNLHFKVRSRFAFLASSFLKREKAFSKIEKGFTIEYTEYKENSFLDLSFSSIHLKDLNKIKIIGSARGLNLQGTPAGSSIRKEWKKVAGEKTYDEFIREQIPNLADHFDIIEFDDKTSFKVDDSWR